MIGSPAARRRTIKGKGNNNQNSEINFGS